VIDSRIADFYRKSIAERIEALMNGNMIEASDASSLLNDGPLLTLEVADKMIENVIGIFGLPLATAPNFRVNGCDYIVPMVIEEPSVVAGVSNAAKTAREAGGFKSTLTDDPVLIGQIQLIDIAEPDTVVQSLNAASNELIDLANSLQPNLLARGGGARKIEFFKYHLPDGRWTVVLHVLIDTRDAMGANIVNSICEGIASRVEEIASGRACLKILSNLTDKSLVTASVTMPLATLAQEGFSADEVRDGIILANEFANIDPYRAATHNKGIMNGIDAVAIATGNDWRAIEAAAHAYAVRNGAYRALTSWKMEVNGDLYGELVIPIKVGVVGGSLQSNPAASIGLRIAGVKSARELAELMGAVGLAQNFAALRVLVTEGIQKGHMSLHARSVATSAGTPTELFNQVVEGMICSGDVKHWKAHQLIDEFQNTSKIKDVENNSEKIAQGTASGKVILLGEHAAVYNRHVLALPLESAVTATIAETRADINLSIIDWDLKQSVTLENPGQSGIGAVLTLIMSQLGISDRGADIHVRSRIPVAMGLGSSAALAVAIIRAFDKLLGLNMGDEAINKLAYKCEKLAHGKPSGIDNNIATYGEPVLYNKSSVTKNQSISLSEPLPIVIASSGIRGITKDQVAGVHSRFNKNKVLYTTIFDEIDELSIAGAIALKSCDYDTLGSLMNVCHGFLNALQVSTPELEKMVNIARSNGAIGAKLTGAGGGGSIVALCPGEEFEVAQGLYEAGYQIVRMREP
jgi:hydroxymethylglutaryl-CoA reductase